MSTRFLKKIKKIYLRNVTEFFILRLYEYEEVFEDIFSDDCGYN